MGDGVTGGHGEMAGDPKGPGGGKAAPCDLASVARTEDKAPLPLLSDGGPSLGTELKLTPRATARASVWPE